jgi:hypothetical protein
VQHCAQNVRSGCRNPKCPLSHEPCRFGDKCHNLKCLFSHSAQWDPSAVGRRPDQKQSKTPVRHHPPSVFSTALLLMCTTYSARTHDIRRKRRVRAPKEQQKRRNASSDWIAPTLSALLSTRMDGTPRRSPRSRYPYVCRLIFLIAAVTHRTNRYVMFRQATESQPPPVQPAQQPPAQASPPLVAAASGPQMCPFGFDCKTAACEFVHPPPLSVDSKAVRYCVLLCRYE